MTNLTFNKEELEAILYSLEGYIQGNDDNKLVDELVDICYKIEEELAWLKVKELKANYSKKLVTN